MQTGRDGYPARDRDRSGAMNAHGESAGLGRDRTADLNLNFRQVGHDPSIRHARFGYREPVPSEESEYRPPVAPDIGIES